MSGQLHSEDEVARHEKEARLHEQLHGEKLPAAPSIMVPIASRAQQAQDFQPRRIIPATMTGDALRAPPPPEAPRPRAQPQPEPKPAKPVQQDERQLSETMLRARSGTRIEPYPRQRDDTPTRRIGFTVSDDFAERERVFGAALRPPWNRNKWAEYVLSTAMDAHEENGGTPYPMDFFPPEEKVRR